MERFSSKQIPSKMKLHILSQHCIWFTWLIKSTRLNDSFRWFKGFHSHVTENEMNFRGKKSKASYTHNRNVPFYYALKKIFQTKDTVIEKCNCSVLSTSEKKIKYAHMLQGHSSVCFLSCKNQNTRQADCTENTLWNYTTCLSHLASFEVFSAPLTYLLEYSLQNSFEF